VAQTEILLLIQLILEEKVDKETVSQATFVATTAYFPNISFFVLMYHYRSCILDLNRYYKKDAILNRTYIAAANGKLMLSVPLIKNGIKNKKHYEVEIAYRENWPKNHFESICSAYLKSPFLEIVYDDLKRLILKEYRYLSELNLAIINWICEILQIETNFKLNVDKSIQDNDYQLIVYNNSNKNTLPSWYKNENYFQLFSDKNGFFSNLSILDLLFLHGMDSRNYLKNNLNFDKLNNSLN